MAIARSCQLLGFVLAVSSLVGSVGKADAPPGAVSPIRFPDGTAFPASVPPTASPALTSDLTYIIESDVQLDLIQSPKGLVLLTEEANEGGNFRIRAKFYDGNGKLQTRTYKGKYLYTVEPLMTGKVELIAVPFGFKADSDVVRKTLDVDTGVGPQPPPGPGPGPGPTPDPVNPAPIPSPGFRVMIVYDIKTLGLIPAAQNDVLFNKSVHDYMDAKCVKKGVQPEWRQYDVAQDLTGESKIWQDAFKRPRSGLPWICISTGTTGWEGPLPADAAKTLELLKKFGN